MMFWIIFGAVWGTLAIAGLLLLASVPSSKVASNRELAALVLVCGVVAFLLCLLGQGTLALIGVV